MRVMQPEQLMGTAARLGSSLEALAAVAAYLRVETEQLTVDPRVHDLLRAIAVEVLGEEPGVTRPQGAPVVGMARALLAQSAELVDHPERAAGWTPEDDALLQGIGRQSAPIAGIIAAASGELDGLAAALAAPGASAARRRHRHRLARHGASRRRSPPPTSSASTSTSARSRWRARTSPRPGSPIASNCAAENATRLAEGDTYDAIWLPMPFLPRAIVPAVVEASVAALRPGGWLLPGTFAGPPDPLSRLLVDLRTVRAGGHPWEGADLVGELASHGLQDAHEVPRTWTAPVRLYAARRPS